MIDAGGILKVIESLKHGNRLHFSMYIYIYLFDKNFNFDFDSISVTLDPTIRYTIWSIVIGRTFSSTAQHACIQTQAQRYMCVKDTNAARKYVKIAILNKFVFV